MSPDEGGGVPVTAESRRDEREEDRRWLFILLLGLALGVAVGGAAGYFGRGIVSGGNGEPVENPGGPGIAALTARLLASPCDEDVERPSDQVLALTGGETFEHEVHDCQRLVVSTDQGLRYGPLVGVFPLDAAMELSKEDFETRRVVATIFNWGGFEETGTSYANLGVSARWQCLWLQWLPSEERWNAWTATSATDCRGTSRMVDSTRSGEVFIAAITRLAVKETRVAEFSGHYPKTARWGWDEGKSQHYIGIKCGDAWCEIGSPGFSPRAWPSKGSTVGFGPSAPSVPWAHGSVIPGWHDAQHLAVTDPAVPGGLRPGPYAVVVPAMDIASLSEDDPRWASALHVANVILSDGNAHPDYETYRRKLNIDPGDRYAEIYLRFSSDLRSVEASVSSPGISTVSNWKPREYVAGTEHAARGAVRFRWLATDDGEWISCRAGCCPVE